MVLSMGAFIINDTMLKLAVANIPPLEALMLRGLAATLIGLPMLAGTRALGHLRHAFTWPVLGRNIFEIIGSAGYIVAIAYAPLADITALSQLAPMIVLLGAFLFFGERIRSAQVWLIVVSFFGAVLVAQPGGSGFTPYALLGLWNALCIAGRDLAGRTVRSEVPGLVVAVSAALCAAVVLGIASFLLEKWVAPDLGQIGLILGSGLFLNFGHMFVLEAYRNGSTAAVLPFVYTSTIWALLSGLIVFHTVPNGLALTGIALISASGVLVVLLNRTRPVTTP